MLNIVFVIFNHWDFSPSSHSQELSEGYFGWEINSIVHYILSQKSNICPDIQNWLNQIWNLFSNISFDDEKQSFYKKNFLGIWRNSSTQKTEL